MKRVPIKVRSEILPVEDYNIVRFEAQGKKAKAILIESREIVSTETLKYYEDMLHGKVFYRINGKDMVNKGHVKSFDFKSRAVTLNCGTVLNASFRRRSGFLDFINK